jgi:hypothetical protein
MRIRKRNRIIRRIVLGFAVVALVVPGAAMARVDEGLVGLPNSADEIAKAQENANDQGGIQLADPKYGQTNEGAYVPFVTDFPTYPQTTDVARPVELRDFPKSLPPVELGTYGLPHAGLNDYLRTHNGKAMVDSRGDVSTPQVAVESKGFDWGDAGIGAGILAGLMVAIGAAALATRGLGRPQAA